MIHKKKSIPYINFSVFIIFLFLSVWYLTPLYTIFSDQQISYMSNEVVEGNVHRVNNVDALGNLVFDDTKGYAYSKYVLDAKGLVILELYYDLEDNLCEQDAGYFALERHYDKLGRNDKVTYLGSDLKPIRNKAGYSIVHREFNEDNKIEFELYYDENDFPVTISNGEHGVKYIYDSLQHISEVVYIGMNKQEIMLYSGYSKIKREYNSEGQLELEMYYDIKNSPVRLNRWQYGVKHLGTKLLYVNKYGNPWLYLDNYLNIMPNLTIVFGLLLSILSCFIPSGYRIGVLVGFLGFVAFETFIGRETGSKSVNLELLWSYKVFFQEATIRQQILFNIWLFIPIGSLLYSLIKNIKIIIPIIILSLLIECIQYKFQLGLFEIDDIISNSVGSAMGINIYYCIKKMIVKGN